MGAFLRRLRSRLFGPRTAVLTHEGYREIQQEGKTTAYVVRYVCVFSPRDVHSARWPETKREMLDNLMALYSDTFVTIERTLIP